MHTLSELTLFNAHHCNEPEKVEMKDQRRLGLCLGAGIVIFLLGIVFGWKLHGVRLGYLKKQREYHDQKARELQSKLNH